MPGVVLHRPHLGRRAERVGHPLRGALVIGREGDTDMAIVEDRVVLTVGLLDLVEGLGDQERLDPVARHEGELALEEIKPSERGELVEHEQHAVAALSVQVFSQPPTDLIEHEPDQRLGARDI